MTDITELAPAMKAAAIDAKELAIIARYSKGRAAAEKFYALANPNNVIALVEALEKAQAKATQQGNIACALFDEVAQLRLHADEKSPELRAQLIEADSELEALRNRIAELESHKAALLKFIRDSCYVFDGADEDISDAYIDAITSGLIPKLESVTACNPPLFWVRVKSDGGYEGPIHDSKLEEVRKKSGEWLPLTLAGGIPDLESRTVKLPKPHAHLIWIQAGHAPDDYWDDVEVSHSEKDRCCDGSERYPAYSIFEIQEACVAAGVKLVQSDEPFSLKSRAVKLPKTMYTEFDNDDYCREVAVLDKQQVIDALTAADIKVEAE